MEDMADIPVALLFAGLLGLLEGADESAELELVTTVAIELGVGSPVTEVVRRAVELGTGREEVETSAGAEEDTEPPETAPTPPPPLGGGGAALEGSARVPTPQGIGSLVWGWRVLAGGVVAPVGSAIVNRVVQVLLAAVGEVNW